MRNPGWFKLPARRARWGGALTHLGSARAARLAEAPIGVVTVPSSASSLLTPL